MRLLRRRLGKSSGDESRQNLLLELEKGIRFLTFFFAVVITFIDFMVNKKLNWVKLLNVVTLTCRPYNR